MSWIDVVLSSQITPVVIIVVLASFIVFAFVKGWILSAFQIRTFIELQNSRILESNQRAADYMKLYETERASREATEALIRPIYELCVKILAALPPAAPVARQHEGGDT